MNKLELRDRTKRFALSILQAIDELPNSRAGKTVASPLVRAGTTIGAVCRNLSRSLNSYDFLHRIRHVEDCTDECVYWLEIALEGKLIKPEVGQPLLDESRQLAKLFKNSRRAASKRMKQDSEDIPF